MHVQPDLFRRMCAETYGTQQTMFISEPESGLHCDKCGCPMVRTASGYLACPRGHGKLLEAEESSGRWYEEE